MLDKRWYLFSLLGNKVYMSASFLIVAAVFSFMGVQNASQLGVGLIWIAVLCIGILLHELGHALASKKLGYGQSEIVFWGLGGLAINRFAGARKATHQILISLAGPAVSGLLALVSLGVLLAVEGAITATGYLGKFWEIMFMANAFWAIFNLLPIYPMDGGQALGSGLQIAIKDRAKATRAMGIVSLVTIALALIASVVVFRSAPSLFLLFLAAYFGYLNWKVISTQRQQRFY